MPNTKRSDTHSISSMIFPPIDFNDDRLALGLGFDFGFKSSLDIQAGVGIGVDEGSTTTHQHQFAIPPVQKLDSRPQDPIVEALKRNARARARGRNVGGKNLEIEERDIPLQGEERNGDENGNRDEDEANDVWTLPEVVASPKKHIRTWDDFYPNATQPSALTSPFLSEQTSHIFDAVRYHLNFKLKDPTIHFRYVLPDELWANLKLNILGNSSSLFIWDDTHNHFVPNTLPNGQKVRVTLEGVGDDVFSSAMSVLLSIGANLRRVDEFITRLRQNLDSSPIHASFLHSLASVLSYIQSILSRPPPYKMRQLVGISSWYKIYDQILNALVVLCRCDGKPPFSFQITAPHALLDHIFAELQKMLIIKVSRQVVATLAYILTVTSKEYFYRLAYSIGLLDTSHRPTSTQDSTDSTPVFDDISSHQEPEPLPSFFPKSLVASLPAARKSLSILKKAGLPCQAELDIPFTWVWTAEELEKRWLHDRKDQRELTLPPDNQDTQAPLLARPRQPPSSSSNDKAEGDPLSNDDLTSQVLSQFAIFNLTPGSHSHLLSTNNSNGDDSNELTSIRKNSTPTTPTIFSTFLTTFPEDPLPTISPTLHHLAQIILRPLSIRTTVLSNLSLRLFLDSLHFNSHLHILRSYFFLTSSSFKRKLVNALLYNETLEPPTTGSGAVGWRLAGAGVAIGLAAGLSSDRKIWPPKGSDLSFSLRNVIVNSLEEDFLDNGGGGGEEGANVVEREVVVDAEQKLGFGLRDLPVEDGHARWLDPVSIEALDFLYLDYKTSQPLDVVVTPQTIAKYQRVFTFLLQLTRAETVLRITHQNMYSNSTSNSSPYSIARTLHFQLSTFISSLNGYIYDSIIGGIFDKYLARIDQIRDELRKDNESKSDPDSSPTSSNSISNMNIFMLGESHSRLLDRILRCCLLGGKGSKSKRRLKRADAAENVLRNLMDLVLRFGTVLMELEVKRGRGDSLSRVEDLEAQAEEKLLKLSEEFRAGMIDLITAIRILQETQAQNKHEPESDVFLTQTHRVDNHDFVAAVGEPNAKAQVRDLDQIHLDELLTRIDPSYWWRRQIEKREREG